MPHKIEKERIAEIKALAAEYNFSPAYTAIRDLLAALEAATECRHVPGLRNPDTGEVKCVLCGTWFPAPPSTEGQK